MRQKRAKPDEREVLRRLARELPLLREKYGVESLAPYGSVARGEATASSDVDLVVKLSMPQRRRHSSQAPSAQFHSIALAALALALHVAGCSTERDYEIRLHRPLKPGQKFHISSAGSTSRKTVVTVGGKVTQQTAVAYSAELVAMATIIHVGSAGEPIEVSYRIARCVRTDGGKEEVLVRPGLVLDVSSAWGDTVFAVNGSRLGPQAMEALELVVRLARPGTKEEGGPEGFSPEGRKRIGESWKANAEALAGPLPGIGVSVPKEGIDGMMTLVGITRVGETDCLDLRGTFSAKAAPAPLSPTRQLERVETRMVFAGRLPLDPSLPALEASIEMTTTVRLRERPDGETPESVTEQTAETRLTGKRTPVE
ncbi:MAG: hypothetical protein FJ291_06860 [Planctomycetes bacterium]|nr:hypothetical protein [Planctomycetota bacterium]